MFGQRGQTGQMDGQTDIGETFGQKGQGRQFGGQNGEMPDFSGQNGEMPQFGGRQPESIPDDLPLPEGLEITETPETEGWFARLIETIKGWFSFKLN